MKRKLVVTETTVKKTTYELSDNAWTGWKRLREFLRSVFVVTITEIYKKLIQ